MTTLGLDYGIVFDRLHNWIMAFCVAEGEDPEWYARNGELFFEAQLDDTKGILNNEQVAEARKKIAKLRRFKERKTKHED